MRHAPCSFALLFARCACTLARAARRAARARALQAECMRCGGEGLINICVGAGPRAVLSGGGL